MGRKRAAGPAPDRRKKVLVTVIDRKHAGKVVEAYRLLEELIEAHHEHLREAKIALAWRDGWKADADGRLRLGSVKKASDLDRSLHAYDFVILLNQEAWRYLPVGKRRALLDHELCHCQRACDVDGEQKCDEKDRPVWRLRKHDVEEFREVVQRHGCYTDDLLAFVEAVRRQHAEPIIAELDKVAEATARRAGGAA